LALIILHIQYVLCINNIKDKQSKKSLLDLFVGLHGIITKI